MKKIVIVFLIIVLAIAGFTANKKFFDQSDWKTYTDSQSHVSIKYPPDWYVNQAFESNKIRVSTANLMLTVVPPPDTAFFTITFSNQRAIPSEIHYKKWNDKLIIDQIIQSSRMVE